MLTVYFNDIYTGGIWEIHPKPHRLTSDEIPLTATHTATLEIDPDSSVVHEGKYEIFDVRSQKCAGFISTKYPTLPGILSMDVLIEAYIRCSSDIVIHVKHPIKEVKQ